MARRKRSVSSSGSSSSSTNDSESSSSTHEHEKHKQQTNVKKTAEITKKITKSKIETEHSKAALHSHSSKRSRDRSKARKRSENEKSQPGKKSPCETEVKDNKRRCEDKKHRPNDNKLPLKNEKAKNLFPIIQKEQAPINIEQKPKITETALVSYPSL